MGNNKGLKVMGSVQVGSDVSRCTWVFPLRACAIWLKIGWGELPDVWAEVFQSAGKYRACSGHRHPSSQELQEDSQLEEHEQTRQQPSWGQALMGGQCVQTTLCSFRPFYIDLGFYLGVRSHCSVWQEGVLIWLHSLASHWLQWLE